MRATCAQGRTTYFLPQQLELTGLRIVLALAGLYFCLLAPVGKRFRMIGWMYLITLALFVVLRGRWYYMGPAYPMMYAAGAVWGEGWLATMSRGRAMAVRAVAWVVLAFDIVVTSAFFMPLAPLGTQVVAGRGIGAGRPQGRAGLAGTGAGSRANSRFADRRKSASTWRSLAPTTAKRERSISMGRNMDCRRRSAA